jgi:uncharacterized repeat protein (TIGR03803 family)
MKCNPHYLKGRRRANAKGLVLFLAIAGGLLPAFLGHAQVVEQTIKSFGSAGPMDGSYPDAALLWGLDGRLYGTTSEGGSNDVGTVFTLNSDGSGYQILHHFSSVPNDGSYPVAALIQDSNGVLYGTTPNGGSNNVGTVFKLCANGGGYIILHQFQSSGADGQTPVSALTLGSNGLLFGTTLSGGSNGFGGVFKIGTDGTGYQRLYDFTANGPNDGQTRSSALLQGSDGALYGTTSAGGIYGDGTIFKLNTDGTGYQVIYNLDDPSGGGWDVATGLIFGFDGCLFGVGRTGGTNGLGKIFSLRTDGSGYTLLYSFKLGSSDGQRPNPGLFQGSDGALYGTTYFGGDTMLGGTVFKLATNGLNYSVFWNCGYPSPVNPEASVIQGADGAIYGTCSYGGGGQEFGGVFRLTIFQPSLVIASVSSNNVAQFSLNGVANSTYRIDVSTDLLQWVELTNLLDNTGTVEFADPDSSNYPQRFYRAVWSP